jgi:hypothetical protein
MPVSSARWLVALCLAGSALAGWYSGLSVGRQSPSGLSPVAGIGSASADVDELGIPVEAPLDEAAGVQDGAVGTQLDLQGNDVSHAIATYSLDQGGGIYEEHSPNTEVPKLPTPKG